VRFPDYDYLDACDLARLIARHEIHAAEILEAALERADARNPTLNAIISRFDDEARTCARGALPAGPLSGVPFLLKDLVTAWEGHPLTGGSRFLRHEVAAADSDVVRRLKAAGLILFGQTSTSEFGIKAVTEPVFRGPSRNPWNPKHTPGGSSGGAAAAVAARIVPAAHGNDAGGSLRIPASCCGVFGFKPSRGRVSFGPLREPPLSGLATEGIISRSVRDCSGLLDILSGLSSGDPYTAPTPLRPFLTEIGIPPPKLRIAITRRSFFGHATHPECVAAVDKAARLFRDLGHRIEEDHPAVDRESLVRAYLVALSAQTATDVARATAAVGRRPRPTELEPETRVLAAAGKRFTAYELAVAESEMHRAAQIMGTFHESFDLLVSATMAQPPGPIGALRPRGLEQLALEVIARLPARRAVDFLLDTLAARSFDATGNTMLFNQTGQPAMSLPLHISANGLPVGIQVAARYGEEALLFRLAAQVEAAEPWACHTPPLVSDHPDPQRTA